MDTYPSITLRKGKTEVKVQNPAAVIKKIDEMYPGSKQSYETWQRNQRVDEQVKWHRAAKNWFKSEMFSGFDDFEVIVEDNPKIKKVVISEDVPTIVNDKEIPTININVETEPKKKSPVRIETYEQLEKYFNSIKDSDDSIDENVISGGERIQTVNKNAYEIRLEILKEAIQWSHRNSMATEQDVLNTAKKFYSFVENRR